MKFITLVLILGISVFGQTESNYDLVNNLINKSLADINENIQETEQVYFTSVTQPGAEILQNRIFDSYKTIHSDAIPGKNDTAKNINYALENINIEYSEAFRDNIFSSYNVERKVGVSGIGLISGDGSPASITFNESYTDTIGFDEIVEIEKSPFSYTKGEKPDEPFFKSVLEPVVAVSAVIVTVYLFFDVRSK